MRNTVRHAALVIGLICLAAGSASAHKINLFATAAGEAVSGQVYVDASTPVADATVRVFVGGHRAEWTVSARELPASLPPCGGADTTKDPRPEHDDPDARPPADAESLETMVEQAVARQVAPLRRQIKEYEQRVRLHDIIGGIGYIVGLFGLAGIIIARRK